MSIIFLEKYDICDQHIQLYYLGHSKSSDNFKKKKQRQVIQGLISSNVQSN